MADPQEQFEQSLEAGATVAGAAEAVETPAPPPEAPPSPEPRRDGDWRARVDPALVPLIEPIMEAQRREWESGATPKFQQAKKMEEFVQNLQKNPKGTLAYLSEQLRVPIRFADDAAGPAARPQPESNQATDIPPRLFEVDDRREQLTILRDWMDTRIRQALQDTVGPYMADHAQARVDQEVERLAREVPELPIRQIAPQIAAYNQQLRKAPAVTPEEYVAIQAFRPLLEENRKLRAQVSRPRADADKVAARVAGPSAGAPTTLSPDSMSTEQLASVIKTLFPDR